MSPLLAALRARPHLLIALAVGAIAGVVSPERLHVVTRCLIGWNAGVWLYLAMVTWLAWRADHARLRRTAAAHAEGALTVLLIVVIASLASLGAMVVELSAAKVGGGGYALPHVVFAFVTVVGSWLLPPTLFMFDYASAYYHRGGSAGLVFPGMAAGAHPGYGDFAYFSFTIAVALQTSDVSVTSAAMRRLVLMQSVLSFAFNTSILALTVNLASALF